MESYEAGVSEVIFVLAFSTVSELPNQVFRRADGMSGQFRSYVRFARDCYDNDGKTVFIADVILDDNNGVVALLFQADSLAEVGIA